MLILSRLLHCAALIWPLLLHLSCAFDELSDGTLRSFPFPGHDFDINEGSLLAPILIPRVPGTPGNAKVRQHIVDFFRDQLPEWKLDFQNSTSKTPATGNKEIPFVNIIATRDPPGTTLGDVGRLALVAHYDSLRTPADFIGASDSAASCAMLMHLARTLDPALSKKWAARSSTVLDELDDEQESHKGMQIIFTDGEEAFQHWTDTDSTYGARALAQEWEETLHPANSLYKNQLRSIDLFVLLDLLGAEEDAIIPSWFLTTHWAYKHMADLEVRLRQLGMFKSSPNYHTKRSRADPSGPRPVDEPSWLNEADKKQAQFYPSLMGDDHVPFMHRGVEILHLIPAQFPQVWHNHQGIPDDGEHLDLNKCEDWATLVTAFAAGYMELEGFLPVKPLTNHVRGKSEL